MSESRALALIEAMPQEAKARARDLIGAYTGKLADESLNPWGYDLSHYVRVKIDGPRYREMIDAVVDQLAKDGGEPPASVKSNSAAE